MGGVKEDRPENLNVLRDPHADGPGTPAQRGPSGCAVLLGGLAAAPFVLIGLYLSAMMLFAAAMSATGVSAAGGFVMLLSPVPAIVGVVLGVAAYRAVAHAK
jgi:hypothetical protein